MKVIMKEVCIFMTVIIICSLCGGLFGIVASGTFTASFTDSLSVLTGLKTHLYDPFTQFLSYFGFSTSYGGDAIAYKLEPDEVIYSDFIPDDACFAVILPPFSVKVDKQVFDEGFSTRSDGFIAFFDVDGYPLDVLMLKGLNKIGAYQLGDKLLLGTITSFDYSGCYFNKLAKFVYFDFVVTVGSSESDVSLSYHFYADTSLIEYKYKGNFTDLDKVITSMLGRGNGTGGKS